eukprot:m.64815 g.64815  ORF g.64815 m.64815 type:complete len:316 (+) comp14010_c0_seq16:135-1082(+)
MASEDEMDDRLRARMEAFDGDDYSSPESQGEDSSEGEYDEDASSSEAEDNDDAELNEDGFDVSKLSDEQRELIQFKVKFDKASESGFAALQQLQQQLGSKMFKLFRGRLKNALAHDTLYTAQQPKSSKRAAAQTRDKPARKLAKHAPEEVSSKRRPRGVRNVVAVTKKAGLDPRFQAYAGTYHANVHDQAYRFLDDKREQELDEVRQALRKNKQGPKAEELKRLLQSLKNKAANRHQQRQKWDKQMAARKQMSSEGLLDKDGKRKFHLKRSDERRLELLDKYDKLKSKGRLKKAVKQRRQHNMQKDRKDMPALRS